MEQPKWEYKVVKLETSGFLSTEISSEKLEKLLNEGAKHGYELVSITPINTNGYTREIQIVLKRAV